MTSPTISLHDAMFLYSWHWQGQFSGTIQFLPDGSIKKDFQEQNWLKWEFSKDASSILVRGRDGKITLQFNPDRTGFSGPAWNPKNKITGNRLQRLAPSSHPSEKPVAKTAPVPGMRNNDSLSRIEVIKDQGPNAAEWALTPLDRPIPAGIRQNLTYLREDLLDEASKAPKASPAAYTQASEYCDKLLAAFSQREIARVQAGYRATQADANQATSTQALDARRNHPMSWPQFAREESQRAALRESEADKADVKKQRIKVEWTTRAAQMRRILDDHYRQFREAMRLAHSSPAC
ncbi:hypothetical protein [Prosthecobacter sp.]|uniref:hypothetical protein n=1 Tax=Prosthecobacter sp. TaxID=1965333 RepID=UPI0025CCF029|nr:hypothetical protein [Prosthecobacter sp.]